ncbi:hypothetical protein DdX_13145 [Ditylenchus destructor]|uniref:Uncharacterized protein n=1 Tax=Ditylenchus destructor TaxID=166010 RepID=A0AAD4MWN8_9BILA|nr:hypothetical protein DdX_13145 [Ditylenchus destructor]
MQPPGFKPFFTVLALLLLYIQVSSGMSNNCEACVKICYWLNKRGKFAEELAELKRQRSLLPESEIEVEKFSALISSSFVPTEALQWIFRRCGAFIRHMDFTDYEGKEMINLLDMLPNLHSLVLNDIRFDTPETQQLVDIACKLPNLKLLRLNGQHMLQYHEIFFPAVGQLLFGLQNLEVLEIENLQGYEIGYLPKSLKRFEVSDVYIPFGRLVEWCPELVSLKVDYSIEFVEEVPVFDGLTAYYGLMTKLALMR